jgi:hypothetical protein
MAMRARGFDQSLIEKVYFRNSPRVLGQTCRSGIEVRPMYFPVPKR